MTCNESELDRLLSHVSEGIDIEHCHAVNERYRRTLAYEDVDRPPLVVQPAFGHVFDLPAPWSRFHRYSYREAFDSPCAMLQNMLLDHIVPGLILGDDNPLAIRNNHGTIQIASAVGGNWMLREDDFPWIEHFESLDPIERIADATGPVDLSMGVLPRSFATLWYYRQKLDQFPPCGDAVKIAVPDLQGPLDTADLLWGSDIYYAFTDAPDLLGRLLFRLADVMLQVHAAYKPLTRDPLDPVSNTQHGYQIPGRLLIRDDSAIMLSPDTYAQHVRPHDVRLLREVGGGAIHFCGNGQHLIEKMIESEEVKGLDFGEIHLMDASRIYGACRERKVSVHRVTPPREDIVSGRAKQLFPTGAVFVYESDSVEDALEVVRSHS